MLFASKFREVGDIDPILRAPILSAIQSMAEVTFGGLSDELAFKEHTLCLLTLKLTETDRLTFYAITDSDTLVRQPVHAALARMHRELSHDGLEMNFYKHINKKKLEKNVTRIFRDMSLTRIDRLRQIFV